ncbi:MAG: serine/threonine protein kinase [Myxococcales bacterium]|nr:serine/threonine protein kinase [Myxococcales bacterium]
MATESAEESIERSLAWRRLAGALFPGDADAEADASDGAGEGLAAGDDAPLALDGFTILGVLGRGAMGTVYLARDELLGREVAIKVLAPGESDARRSQVLAEARALAQVSHPAIVAVYAVGERGPAIYIVMERVRGETLRRWQSAPGRRWRELLEVYLEVARGLQAAHERGLVHRDLKPENVLVDGEGRARIVDFGLARPAAQADAERPGEVAGTPAYMAPEQRQGAPPRPSMDQYSFAVALHEALYGALPGAVDSHDMSDRTSSSGAIGADAPPAIRAILRRALAAEPGQRWPSMLALRAALEGTLAATPAERARLLLLARVEASWIDGVLARPGDDAQELHFGPAEGRARPDLVDGGPTEPGHERLSIEAAAASAEGSLLLVGGLGSGKTTALLTLARAALRRARRDPTSPAPVVLGLASWAQASARRRLTLGEWVVAELRDKYGIPGRLAAAWIADDALALLLDGLDEVAPERRAACVKAIAEHRREHLAPLIVSGRTSVCEALAAAGHRLPLAIAVELGRLDPAQVEVILDRGGEAFAGLRAAFSADAALRELLCASPLLLDIAAQAFRGRPPAAIARGAGSREALGQRIWSAYVARALERRPLADGDAGRDFVRRLGWLARGLEREGAAELWIERMQPTWLEGQGERGLFAALAIAAAGLGAAAIIGALLGLATSAAIALPTAALAGLALAAFVAGSLGVARIRPLERLAWSWRAMVAGAGRASARGLLLGLAIAAIAALVWGRGASTSVAVAVFVANLVVYAGLFGVMLVVLAGLVGAAPSGSWRPNQGIRNAARNAGSVAAIVALALALPMLTMTAIVGAAAPESIFTAEAAPSPALREATAVWSRDPLRFVVAVELCIALTLGYVAGLLRGGFAVIQHGVLRFLLRGRLPLGLVALLEAASERALLQRIGGGYRFVHAGLREHLAGEAARSGA